MVATRQWEIRESICGAQCAAAVKAGLPYTDIRGLGQTEVDDRRAEQFVLWANTFKARLKDDATEETRLRSEMDTNLKALKNAKDKALEEFHSLNGTGPSVTTNGPQASHGTPYPEAWARTPTFASTPRPTTTTTSIRHEAPQSVPQSSYQSASGYSQPPTTNPSARTPAQTRVDELVTQIASIDKDRGLSPSARLAKIRDVCASSQANTGTATSGYMSNNYWQDGLLPMTACV